MKPMYFITNKKSKRKNRSIRRVYTDVTRCYITYLLVIAVILIAPIDNSIIAVTGEMKTEKHTNLTEKLDESQEVNASLLYKNNIFDNDIEIKSNILRKDFSIVATSQKEYSSDISNEINEINEENTEECTVKEENTTEVEIVEIEEPSEIIQQEEVVEEIVDYYYDEVTSSSSVKSSSGLSAEQINKLLEGTDLYGIGQAVYDVEQINGINSYFTISVASLESGFGSSRLAKNKNNIFGMYNCSFDSFDSCVKYFGELMNKYEYNHNIIMTTEAINKRYCETDSWTWKVVSLMNKYIRKANELY